MKEAIRYLHNARGILRHAPREGRVYTDLKPVQEACGTAYLAILKAIDEYLLAHGLTQKELPKSVDGYRQMLRKYVAVHNGKLFREFENLYYLLHLAGYYRKLLIDVPVVKEALNSAQQFISRLNPPKKNCFGIPKSSQSKLLHSGQKLEK